MLDLPALQKLLEPLFPGLMGVRIIEAAPDRVVAEMPVRADLCTAGGILHGGATMAFADTLGAVGTILNLAAGKRTTTTDSSTKFIAGARVDTVVTAGTTNLAVAVAWAYVALRIVHSLIHLTYNRVMHRLTAFAISSTVLALLWVLAALHLAANPLA